MWAQCLVRQWIRGLRQYLAFGQISHNFCIDVDSDREVFGLRSHAEVQPMLHSQSLDALLALGTLETLLTVSSWLTRVMMGVGARAQALAHVEFVSVTVVAVPMLCGHTHPSSSFRNNNKNNNNNDNNNRQPFLAQAFETEFYQRCVKPQACTHTCVW